MQPMILGAMLLAVQGPLAPDGPIVRIEGQVVREGPGQIVQGRVVGRVTEKDASRYTLVTPDGEELTFPRAGAAVRGRLVRVDPDALIVALKGEDRPARIPFTAVRAVQALGGRRSAWDRGLAVGAVIGGTYGLLAGLSLCGNSLLGCQPGGAAVLFGGIGGLAGASVGAVFRRDRWEPLDPGQYKVTVHPRAGGAGISVSFGLPRH